jgi:uncharacterized protein GlcG (DUF336 family)
MHWKSALPGWAGALPLAALLVVAATPAGAQGVLKVGRLSATLAHEMLVTAVETCAKQNQAVSGVVLDSSGNQQAFLRGDGAGIHTVETADYKAYTALSFRTDGIDLVARARGGTVPGAINKLPRLLLAQGGVLVKMGNEIIGAIGISGARGNNIDTDCARAGIAKVRDRIK